MKNWNIIDKIGGIISLSGKYASVIQMSLRALDIFDVKDEASGLAARQAIS